MRQAVWLDGSKQKKADLVGRRVDVEGEGHGRGTVLAEGTQSPKESPLGMMSGIVSHDPCSLVLLLHM